MYETRVARHKKQVFRHVQKQQERVNPEVQEAIFTSKHCTKPTSLCSKIRFYNLI